MWDLFIRTNWELSGHKGNDYTMNVIWWTNHKDDYEYWYLNGNWQIPLYS